MRHTGERGRAHDERGQRGQRGGGALVVRARHHRDGLQRLAQPHVVAQHAVQLVLVKEPQPVHARLPIGQITFFLTLTHLGLVSPVVHCT